MHFANKQLRWRWGQAAGLLVAIAIVLSACGGRRATPTPTPQPTATATTAATDVPRPTPQPTVTAPVVPTEVPAATATAAPASADEGGVTAPEPSIEAQEATVAPQEVLTETATPDLTATSLPAVALESSDLVTATLPAPEASATPTTTFPSTDPDPLQIEVMRVQTYPGSEITFEQTLDPGANYQRYIVSYLSDGYRIHALMTIPDGEKPASGWPAIIFNHGYIPPAVYRTTERYVAYVDAIARSGYIVFKSDYRGHGSSEGPPEGGYGGPGYTDDVLNALASVKAYKDTDPNRIGMWGHSMGGSLTLRAMVVLPDIKAGVIWGGVVAPYPDIFARGNRQRPNQPARPTPTALPPGRFGPYGRPWRQELTEKYGTPEQNPAFWASISPNSYLNDISGPLQLDHSVTDEEVPVEASQKLFEEMQAAGKYVELYTYPGDNHNISANFNLAMQRSIAFFDKYVKGE